MDANTSKSDNEFFVSTYPLECFVLLIGFTYLLSKVHESLGFFLGTVAIIALILRIAYEVHSLRPILLSSISLALLFALLAFKAMRVSYELTVSAYGEDNYWLALNYLGLPWYSNPLTFKLLIAAALFLAAFEVLRFFAKIRRD